MNANPVNKTALATAPDSVEEHPSAEEHRLEQELVEAATKASLSKGELDAALMVFQEKLTRGTTEGEEAATTSRVEARANEETRGFASGAVARAEVKAAAQMAAAVEEQAAEREMARAAKKQRVNDKCKELEQANLKIEQLQNELADMNQLAWDLMRMLKEQGSTKDILERMSDMDWVPAPVPRVMKS